MSLSSDNMLKLMAYADGELEGADLEAAQKLLATDADAARFVEQIAGLGDIVARGHATRSGKTIAKFDVTDAVMSLVKDEKKDTKAAPIAKVASLAAAREKANKGGGGLKVVGAVAAVLALAASIFVFAQHRTDEVPMAKGPAVAPAAAPAGTSGTGVDVSTVNSPGNSVSVFYLPTANELSTSVVVWVDETGEK